MVLVLFRGSEIQGCYIYTPISAQDHVITIPDGRKVNVQCIGTVYLNNGVKLREVLYVPEFHFNLISVTFYLLLLVVSFRT